MLRYVQETCAQAFHLGPKEALPQLLPDALQIVHQGSQPSEETPVAQCTAFPGVPQRVTAEAEPLAAAVRIRHGRFTNLRGSLKLRGGPPHEERRRNDMDMNLWPSHRGLGQHWRMELDTEYGHSYTATTLASGGRLAFD
jgi:hypothetical protein